MYVLDKRKKIRYTTEKPQLFFYIYIKVGFKGVYISRTCFHDEFVNDNNLYE